MNTHIFKIVCAQILFCAFIPLVAKSEDRFFKGADLYFTGSAFIPQKEGKEKHFDTDAGIRLNFSSLSAIFATSMEAPNESARYGLSLTLNPSIFKATLLAGTLNFAGGVSRLKNPCLEIPSALRPIPRARLGIAPSLPTFSQNPRPLAVSLTLTPAQTFLPSLQVAYTEEKETYVSMYEPFRFTKTASLSTSFSAGLFKYGKEMPKSPWWQKERCYMEGSFASLEGECALSTKHTHLGICAGLHESPFGGAYSWLRGYGALSFTHAQCIAEAFVSDPALITAKGSSPRTIFQAQINPQCSFSLGKATLRVGLLFATGLHESNTVVKEEYRTSSQKAEVNLSLPGAKLNLLGTIAQEKEAEKLSLKGSISLGGAKFSSVTGAGLEHTEKKDTYTVSQSFSLKNQDVCSVYGDGTFVYKEGNFYSAKAESGILIKKHVKKVNCTLKLTFLSAF